MDVGFVHVGIEGHLLRDFGDSQFEEVRPIETNKAALAQAVLSLP